MLKCLDEHVKLDPNVINVISKHFELVLSNKVKEVKEAKDNLIVLVEKTTVTTEDPENQQKSTGKSAANTNNNNSVEKLIPRTSPL